MNNLYTVWMKELELDPCPFCGHPARVYCIKDKDKPFDKGVFYAKCSNTSCAAKIEMGRRGISPDEQELRHKWNQRRAPLLTPDMHVDPCPCCGSPINIEEIESPTGMIYDVSCSCEYSCKEPYSTGFFSGLQNAIDAWHKREPVEEIINQDCIVVAHMWKRELKKRGGSFHPNVSSTQKNDIQTEATEKEK